jgi:hypothetical protein
VRRLVATVAVAAVTAGAGTLAGTAGAAGAPTARLTKWNEISAAAFAGGRLVALDTETVRVRGAGTGGRPGPVAFVYWKTDAVSSALTANRLRFRRGAFDTEVAVRTSIGSLTGSRLAADGTAFLVVAGGRGFPPPVVWCCDAEGREVTLDSDGRAGAPAPFAGGFDGPRVRRLVRAADGAVSLVSGSPQLMGDPDAPDPTRTEAPLAIRPARGLAAIARGTLAWADPPAAGTVQVAVPSDAGIGEAVSHRLGGRVLGVWADPGLVVALVRSGRLHRVVRIPAGGAPRVVWSGRRTPRVAVGRGAVVVADGRRILASRGGALRRVAQARGDVAAVAADATRAAWFERLTRRTAAGAAQRVTVARLTGVPR